MNVVASGWPPSVASRSHTPHPLAPVLAQLAASHLDRRVADGVDPSHSPIYAARSRRLGAEKSRRMLARSLERLVEEADASPRPPSLSSAVRPSRARIHEARPQLLMLASRLRADAAVNPRCLAALRVLLTDGAGPVYTHGDPEALKRSLETIENWIEP
jgi:hypothetical protein